MLNHLFGYETINKTFLVIFFMLTAAAFTHIYTNTYILYRKRLKGDLKNIKGTTSFKPVF